MKYPPYKFILAGLDFLLIRLAISAALRFRGISRVAEGPWDRYLLSPEFSFFFLASLAIVLVFQNFGLYKIDVALSRSKQLVALARSFLYAVLGLAAIAFFVRSRWIIDSRLALLYFGFFGFTFLAAYRIFIFRPLYIAFGRKDFFKTNILIVGSNIEARSLAVAARLDNIYGLRLVGFIDDNKSVGTEVFEEFEVLGRVEDIPRLVKEKDIREIIITVSEIGYERFLKIVDICSSTLTAVTVSSALFNVIHTKAHGETYFDIPIARIGNPQRPRLLLMFKRVVDFAASLAGLVVLSIPLGAIAAIIKFSSPGPVLFRQTRIGKNGRPFTFYKFRSMLQGSDQDQRRVEDVREFIKGKKNGNGSTKVVNEGMITPIGRILRKTSLDEMPQLFNVLKGDMSLVGPRPCLPYEYDAYEDWHKRRLSVTPGCTGLWQVSSRSKVGFDDMVLLDLFYIDNQSPWLDMQLILKTIPVMLLGRGGK